MSEFEPCPFCKRTDGFQVKTVWKTYKFVACQCKAAGPVMRTEDEAIEAWNHRPLDTCTFSLEYDRKEVERRNKAYEANPFGLFPQDMPQVAWTCSGCGNQYKAHFGPDEKGAPRVLPLPSWMKCCPMRGEDHRLHQEERGVMSAAIGGFIIDVMVGGTFGTVVVAVLMAGRDE